MVTSDQLYPKESISSVKGRIDEIDILLVHPILRQSQTFAEALEVDHFTCSQELNDIIDIRVVREPQDVIIRDTRFLFRGQILRQISDQVTLDCHAGGTPREPGCGSGIDTGSAIHKVGIKAGRLDLILAEVSGQLVDDGPYNFQMPQFLSAYNRVKMEPETKNARIARVSSTISSRNHECADSRIPVFHEYGAGGNTAQGEVGVAD